MKIYKESKENSSSKNTKWKSSFKGDFLFFLIILIIPVILFYIYYKLFQFWFLFLLALFILIIDFELWIDSLLKALKEKYPFNSFVYYDEYYISLSISSILILLFYFLTKSKIIASIFFVFFILGVSLSEYRKTRFMAVILTSISLIAFYFAYENNDIFLYIFSIILFLSGMLDTEIRKNMFVTLFFLIISIIVLYKAYINKNFFLYILSTFLFAYIFVAISRYLGKNLEKRRLIEASSFLFIISLSITLFMIQFYIVKTMYLIGLLVSSFFGIIFLDQLLKSLLINTSFFIKENDPHIAYLSAGIFSLILFTIFFFYDYNLFIYIVASLYLIIGGLSSKLFLIRFFSTEISSKITPCFSEAFLGLIIIITYFLYIKISVILLIGLFFIADSIRMFHKIIKKSKL